MSSATQISPQKSDIENEDLFASTSSQHEPSGGFLHMSVCVCVCVCGEATRQLQVNVILIFLIISALACVMFHCYMLN